MKKPSIAWGYERIVYEKQPNGDWLHLETGWVITAAEMEKRERDGAYDKIHIQTPEWAKKPEH